MILDCIEERLGRGEFTEVVQHVAVIIGCWIAYGEQIGEVLLTEGEKELMAQTIQGITGDNE